MADLSSLFRVAPITAAGFTGYNQGQAEQYENLRQMELSQLMQNRMGEESRKASLHPYEIEAKRLGNLISNAQLPGYAADSTSKQINARINQETADSKIAEANVSSRVKGVNSAAQGLGNFSDSIGRLPATERHKAMEDYYNMLGIPNEYRDQFRTHFGRFSGDQLPAEIKRINEGLLRNNPQYAQTMDQEKEQQRGATERSKILAQNRVEVKGMGGAGGSKNPAIDDFMGWLQIELKGKPPATRLAILNQYIQKARAAGQNEIADRLTEEARVVAQTIATLPNAQPNPGAPDIGAASGNRVPTHQTQTPFVPGGGAPQPQPQAADPNKLRRAIASAGWPYEPNKYDYRVAPDGVVERKLKGK